MENEALYSRMLRSREVLLGWRAVAPSGRVLTTLSMIAEEIDVLNDLALEHPNSARALDDLAAQWQQLAVSIGAG